MLWAVIMAGGVGSRFWPESRKTTPKQFLPFFGKQTLLEATAERLKGVVPPSRLIVITQKDKVRLVKKLIPQIPSSQIVGEPVGRNTAPCAVLAAAIAQKKDPHAVIVLLPADHHIQKKSAFQKALKGAHALAKESLMPVTFGVKPTSPHTGYGYLETQKAYKKKGMPGAFLLKRFCEKPSLHRAKKYYRSKKFYWNSGIFVWSAQALLDASSKHLNSAYDLAKKITKGPFQTKMESVFPKMPSISIDYGLMEKLGGKILTLPVNFGWNDVGGWYSFGELCAKDREHNVLYGDVLCVESRENIVRGKKRLITLLGIENLVVVDTEDALMICRKDNTEDIRKIVEKLKNQKYQNYL